MAVWALILFSSAAKCLSLTLISKNVLKIEGLKFLSKNHSIYTIHYPQKYQLVEVDPT